MTDVAGTSTMIDPLAGAMVDTAADFSKQTYDTMGISDMTSITTMERRSLITRSTWTTTQDIGNEIFELDFPNALFRSPSFPALESLKIHEYVGAQAAKFTLTMSASPFAAGALQLIWRPASTGHTNFVGAGALQERMENPDNMIDTYSMLLNIGEGNTATLTVPLTNVLSVLRTLFTAPTQDQIDDINPPDSAYNTWGTIAVRVFNKLMGAEDEDQNLEIRLWCELVEPQLSLLRAPKNPIPTAQTEGIVLGTMAAIGGAIAAAAPSIAVSAVTAGSVAAATTLGHHIVGKKCTYYTEIGEDPMAMNLALSNDRRSILSLGYDVKDFEDSTVDLNDGPPEDDLRAICSRRSRIITLNTWTATAAQGVLLYKAELHPLTGTKFEQGNPDSTVSLSNLGLVASLFSFWRGSITMTFEVVGNAYSRGALLLVYVPSGQVLPADLETATAYPHATLNVSEVRKISFRVPYNNIVPWLVTPKLGLVDDRWTVNAPTDLGRLALFVLNPLRTNDASKITTLPINIYIHSDDADFRLPDPNRNLAVASFVSLPETEGNYTSTPPAVEEIDQEALEDESIEQPPEGFFEDGPVPDEFELGFYDDDEFSTDDAVDLEDKQPLETGEIRIPGFQNICRIAHPFQLKKADSGDMLAYRIPPPSYDEAMSGRLIDYRVKVATMNAHAPEYQEVPAPPLYDEVIQPDYGYFPLHAEAPSYPTTITWADRPSVLEQAMMDQHDPLTRVWTQGSLEAAEPIPGVNAFGSTSNPAPTSLMPTNHTDLLQLLTRRTALATGEVNAEYTRIDIPLPNPGLRGGLVGAGTVAGFPVPSFYNALSGCFAWMTGSQTLSIIFGNNTTEQVNVIAQIIYQGDLDWDDAAVNRGIRINAITDAEFLDVADEDASIICNNSVNNRREFGVPWYNTKQMLPSQIHFRLGGPTRSPGYIPMAFLKLFIHSPFTGENLKFTIATSVGPNFRFSQFLGVPKMIIYEPAPTARLRPSSAEVIRTYNSGLERATDAIVPRMMPLILGSALDLYPDSASETEGRTYYAYECEPCRDAGRILVLATSWGLVQHLNNSHTPCDQMVKCPACDKSAQSWRFENHNRKCRIHETNFKCTVCPHVSGNAENTLAHIWNNHRSEYGAARNYIATSGFRSEPVLGNKHRLETQMENLGGLLAGAAAAGGIGLTAARINKILPQVDHSPGLMEAVREMKDSFASTSEDIKEATKKINDAIDPPLIKETLASVKAMANSSETLAQKISDTIPDVEAIGNTFKEINKTLSWFAEKIKTPEEPNALTKGDRIRQATNIVRALRNNDLEPIFSELFLKLLERFCPINNTVMVLGLKALAALFTPGSAVHTVLDGYLLAVSSEVAENLIPDSLKDWFAGLFTQTEGVTSELFDFTRAIIMLVGFATTTVFDLMTPVQFFKDFRKNFGFLNFARAASSLHALCAAIAEVWVYIQTTYLGRDQWEGFEWIMMNREMIRTFQDDYYHYQQFNLNQILNSGPRRSKAVKISETAVLIAKNICLIKATNNALTLLRQQTEYFITLARQCRTVPMGKMRVRPSIITLQGAPQCGKTFLATTLIPHYVQELFEWEKEPAFIVNSASDNFMSGYSQQMCTMLDDFLQLKDGKDLAGLFQMIGNAPFRVSMAALDEKGTQFLSELICLTMNEAHPKIDKWVSSPDAVYERIYENYIHVKVKPAFLTEEGKLNVHKVVEKKVSYLPDEYLDFYVAKFIDGKRKPDLDTGHHTDGKRISFYEVIARTVEMMKFRQDNVSDFNAASEEGGSSPDLPEFPENFLPEHWYEELHGRDPTNGKEEENEESDDDEDEPKPGFSGWKRPGTETQALTAGQLRSKRILTFERNCARLKNVGSLPRKTGQGNPYKDFIDDLYWIAGEGINSYMLSKNLGADEIEFARANSGKWKHIHLALPKGLEQQHLSDMASLANPNNNLPWWTNVVKQLDPKRHHLTIAFTEPWQDRLFNWVGQKVQQFVQWYVQLNYLQRYLVSYAMALIVQIAVYTIKYGITSIYRWVTGLWQTPEEEQEEEDEKASQAAAAYSHAASEASWYSAGSPTTGAKGKVKVVRPKPGKKEETKTESDVPPLFPILKGNVVQLSVGPMSIRALGWKGDILIVNRHFIRLLEEGQTVSMTRYAANNLEREETFSLVYKGENIVTMNWSENEPIDLCLWKTGWRTATFKDLSKHFLRETDIDRVTGQRGYRVSDIITTLPSLTYTTEEAPYDAATNTNLVFPLAIVSAGTAGKGLCGTPWVVENTSFFGSTGKICGIHAFGGQSYIGAVPITIEGLEACEVAFKEPTPTPSEVTMVTTQADAPLTFHKVHGKVAPNEAYVQPRKTEIKASPVIGEIVPVTHQPAVLSNRDPRLKEPEIFDETLLKKTDFRPTWIENDDEAILAGDQIFKDIAELPKPIEPRCLTLDEAINGVDGAAFMQEAGLEMKKSPGYPWNRLKPGNGKYPFFKDAGCTTRQKWEIDDPRLAQRVEERLSLARKGKTPNDSIWLDVMKDELRPTAKCATGNTRIINAPPLDLMIVMNVLFGAFRIFWMDPRNVGEPLESALGVDPKKTWPVRGLLMKTALTLFGIDFTKFDSTQALQFYEHIGRIINSWYDLSPQNTPQDNLARLTLLREVGETLHLYGDLLYTDDHGLPSGVPGGFTTIFNILVNRLLAMITFGRTGLPLTLYKKYTRNLFMGDDGEHVVLRSEKPEINEKLKNYNRINLAAVAKEIGMKVTMPDKISDLTESDAFHDMTFLKCNYSDAVIPGFFLPGMSKETIGNLINWYRPKHNPNQFETNILEALKFAAPHGSEFYNELRGKLRENPKIQAIYGARLAAVLPPFETVFYETYLEGGHPIEGAPLFAF